MALSAIRPGCPGRPGYTRRHRTMRVWSVAAGVTLLAATACSSSGDESASSDTTTLTLGYYAAAGDPADTTMRELVDEFTAGNPDIDVEIQAAPYGDFFSRLRTQIAGGDAPDVWLSDGVLVDEFAARGSLLDLSDRVAGLNEDDFHGIDLNRTPDGEIYGFPQGAQTPVLFYNTAMFEQAGIDPPDENWTYDDLAAAAEQLTVDENGDGTPEVYGMRVHSSGFTESWWPMIKAFGGDIVTDDNTTVAVDSRESRQALQWMLDAIGDDGFAPDGVTTESLGGPHQLFANQMVAMIFGIYARSLPAISADVEFDVAPLPTGPGGERGNVAIVNSWVINNEAGDEAADAAWRWIEYFAGEEPQTRWAELGEAIPINRAVAESDAFLNSDTAPAGKQVFLDALESSEDLGVNAVWAEYTGVLNENIMATLDGGADVDTALAEAQSKAQEAIDRFYAESS
ncbi:ABC transporter substrate-binding protein [Phytoactinopolyspora halotolerans]|uniref:ABC transporter substrate-binding protein n=1 Tax=Phytoactinopolyspora halotolerans TaxID=1981512 RepID=A0A6L9SDX5_9ACTN|nr:ABC transporter substrate-binding protein [Phytoactinopolyspora halotolerans]NEE02738.1 ABC transporter substrate-binding protein [Phytoactinopolyspora halotolerans]